MTGDTPFEEVAKELSDKTLHGISNLLKGKISTYKGRLASKNYNPNSKIRTEYDELVSYLLEIRKIIKKRNGNHTY